MPDRRRKDASGGRRAQNACSIRLNIFTTVITWCLLNHFKSWLFMSEETFRNGPPGLLVRSKEPFTSVMRGLESQCLAALAPGACPIHSVLAWDDWKACIQKRLEPAEQSAARFHNNDDTFDSFIVQCKSLLPWMMSSNHTAVLLEFRALEQQMRFSVENIMSNLPVHWRLQIVGGPAICQLASKFFAAEVAAEKVVLTPLPHENVEQNQISQILTDKEGFYDKLKGDVWLFFQYDSVICRKQRYLLHTFLEREHGWWGAPWDFWGRTPKMCGNGGFSLRTRRFIEAILTRVPWKDGLSEDMYFCHAAADLYNDLAPELRPAPVVEEIPFSVETIWFEAPFAVHKFWPHLHVSTPAMAIRIIEQCPEVLGILPGDLVANSTMWRDIVCAAQLDRGSFRKGTNVTFDFDHTCA